MPATSWTAHRWSVAASRSKASEERETLMARVEAENAKLTFTDDGIAEIARIAAHVNDRMENIGARRLHTVMTTLLEEILYELPDRESKEITVDRAMVTDRLKEIVEDEDLRRYIL